jgi:hypothetical protein
MLCGNRRIKPTRRYTSLGLTRKVHISEGMCRQCAWEKIKLKCKICGEIIGKGYPKLLAHTIAHYSASELHPAVKNAAGNITGLITLMSIVGNVPSDKVDLAEVELPSNAIEKDTTKIICPYCQSQFKDKSEMSKHIDRIHISGGLLEGDMRQW